MANGQEKLNNFPPLSKSEWSAKVKADLKGTTVEALRHRTAGGLTVEPIYAAEDVADAVSRGVPGGVPYCRGAASLGGWSICQEYDDPRLDVCRDAIAEDLQRGVEAVWLRVGPRRGCRVLTLSDLETLLAPVELPRVPVCLEAGADTLAVAAAFAALAERRGVKTEDLRGGFAFDPLGVLVSQGGIEGGLNGRLAEVRDLASWCTKHAPRLRAVCVSAHPYHEGGASDTQELAWSIAVGVEYLRQLTDAGLSVDEAALQLSFGYPSSDDFFLQIAKFRAARWLWSKVVLAAGADASSAAMRIHARTSRFTKTKRDPWVNMLRATGECTAAVLGGAQSVATLPFDVMLGPANELARRVARNTQMVLRDESHLHSVADPAGGSWFVERLTEDLARAAWEEFREIEKGGGVVEALRSGRLADAASLVAGSRRRRIATRKTRIVGVNEFPNLGEEPVRRGAASSQEIEQALERSLGTLDPAAHREQLVAISELVHRDGREGGALTGACIDVVRSGGDLYSLATILRHGQPDFHLEPITSWEPAGDWELLRDRSDRHAEETGERPAAFLANLGAVPAHRTRSTWARNLLAAAGIEVDQNSGFDDPKALADSFRELDVRLAVLCGSDDDYTRLLKPAVEALKEADCALVLVAGRPKQEEDELREAGVDDFLYEGAEVLPLMSGTLDHLGVKR